MPESLGKTLKKIRETKHLSVEEVSERTRIAKKIIAAVEEDRLHEVSSDFYARNFVKSYAQFLGALEEKVVKQYLSGMRKKDESVLILDGERVPGDWFIKHKKHIGIGIAAIFGIWLVLFSFTQMVKFVKNVSAKYKAQVVKRKEDKLSEAKPRTTPVRGLASDKEGIELDIVARYNTWVRVISDKETLFRGILKKGTTDVWQAKKEIQLELGNAGGVTLKLNGKNLGSPGKKGEKKEIVITQEGIKD